jgi:pantoate--beta-alanine ligase
VVVVGLPEKVGGSRREGHFRGVTTVVTKLLNIVTPHYAFFGRKDAQQAIIIKRMVKDLSKDAEIVVCPIMRDEDGLALSSRNAYLSPDERQAATVLYRALEKAQVLYGSGERETERILAAMESILGGEPGARVDYIAIVDTKDLEPVDVLEDGQAVLIALAVFIGKTRLIDNIVLNGEI